jgi:hypothetical protein
MRLRDILKAKPVGNAYSDEALLDAIDKYIVNPRTAMADKVKAAAKMDEVMGLDSPADPEYSIRVYLATREQECFV